MQSNPRAYLQMYMRRHQARLSGLEKLHNLAGANDNGTPVSEKQEEKH